MSEAKYTHPVTSQGTGRKIPPVRLESQPYPVVKGASNPATVSMLKEDYAGAHGELTGIAQYLFQNIRTTNDDSFANAMLQIAIAEMNHLDLLGDAIQALGGTPSFDDGQYYWQAGNVNYADNMADMLRADIESESTAIDNYEKHAAMTDNASVKALLKRIVEDEKLHRQFFTEMLAMTK